MACTRHAVSRLAAAGRRACRHDLAFLLGAALVHTQVWLCLTTALLAATPYMLTRLHRTALRAQMRRMHRLSPPVPPRP